MLKVPKKLFISTGDPSGDHHAAGLIQSLQTFLREPPHEEVSTQLAITAIGGARLTALAEALTQNSRQDRPVTLSLLADHEQMARAGLGAFAGAPYHFFLGQQILRFLRKERPDLVLLIDYGGFHLWLAPQIKRLGIPVHYFIPPQVWASRRHRLKTIQRAIDHIYCIFPFEQKLYEHAGVPVTYVGHPLVGQLPAPVEKADFCTQYGLDPERPIIGLLPGSRKMELASLLGPLAKSAKQIEAKLFAEGKSRPQFVLAQAPSLNDVFFEKQWQKQIQGKGYPEIRVLKQATHAVMSASDALVVASGTATLESALYRTPLVLIYRGPWLAYWLFRKLCYLPQVGLPNLLHAPDLMSLQDYPPVPELLQDEMSPANIASHVVTLLDPESAEHKRALTAFQQIRERLGFDTADLPLMRLAQCLLMVLGLREVCPQASPNSGRSLAASLK